MRVALITMQLGRSYVHGTERYVRSLGRELGRQGHDVIYLAGNPRDAKRDDEIGGLIDPELPLYNYPSRGPTAVHGYSTNRVAKWLGEQAPDLVHVAALAHIGAGALLAASQLDLPTVATVMDFWWVCPRGTLLRCGREECGGTPGWKECLACTMSDHDRASRRTIAPLLRNVTPLAAAALTCSVAVQGGRFAEVKHWMHRRSGLAKIFGEIDQVIFPSPATRDRMLAQLGHDRWTEIPFGLDDAYFNEPHRFDPSTTTHKPFAPESLIYGFAGSLQSHKGPHLLLEAARRLGWADTRIRIAGTIDDREYWDRLVASAKGLSVEFVGSLSQPEIIDFYRGLDVLVLSSRWPENLPFVLLEAQAAGLAVIGSDVAGIAHRIPSPQMCFKSNSAQDLARVMRELSVSSLRNPPPPVSRLKEMVSATEFVYREAIEHNHKKRNSG